MRKASMLAGTAAMAIAAMLASNTASAADIAVEPEPVAESRWYLSLFGGIKFGEDWETSVDCHGEPCYKKEEVEEDSFDATIETDNGWRVSGAVGYMLSEGFAIEGELSYLSQDFDGIDEDDFEDIELDGDVGIFTGMVNLIAGIPMGNFFRPYVGVGAGIAHVSWEDDDGFFDDEDDTSFALQGLAGIDFALGENVALGVRGRLLHIGDLEGEGSIGEIDCEHDIDLDLIPSIEVGITIGL